MAQVASLDVRLKADISNYESAMKKATSIIENIKKSFNSLPTTFQNVSKKMDDLGKKMEDMSKKAEKASKSMDKIGKGMTKYVTTPIMGAVGVGLNFNSTMEDAMTNFTTLLGSADKAQSMVSNLQSMASKTPFGMADLQSGAQTLLSFGQSAESIMPTLKMLGDISLGNKQKFESLTLAFAQVQSTGKLTGQDLMQMINAGFNPLQIISEKTGKSIGELREIMEKGGISADMVTAAFKSATSEGGRFFNGMESASKTFAGRLSTLKDTFMELAGAFSQPVFDVLKEKMASLTDKLSNLINWFKNLDEGTKKRIATFALIVAAIGPVILIFSKFIGMISGITSAFSLIGSGIKGLSGAFGALKTGFGGLSKIFSLIAAHPIVAVLIAVVGALIYLYNTNEQVRASLQNLWESLKVILGYLVNGIKIVVGFIVNIIKSIIQFVVDVFKKNADFFKQYFQNIWDTIVTVLTAIIDIFAEAFGFVSAILQGDWGQAWEHAKNIVKKAVGAIIVVVLNLVDNMLLGFQKLSEVLLDKVFAGITKGFQSMVNGLLKGWNWLAGKFGWKQVAYLQIDTDKYKVSSAIQKVRNELGKVADYWRGGEKAELPFSFTTTKGKKPDVPSLPKLGEMPDFTDYAAFDNLDTTTFNNLDTTFSDIGQTAESAKDGVDKLADSVQNLVESIRQQTESFRDALGMFDTFERKVVSPERLLNRMKAQVKAMSQWTSALATLHNRGVNQSFLNELRAMGPQNVDYIRALAQMSDEQLAQYQALYGQKYNIAQKEAERMVTTEQKIEKYVEQEITIQISGNKISSDDDVDRIAKEIVRKLKLKGV
jgi:tape measure domain-containing protein